MNASDTKTKLEIEKLIEEVVRLRQKNAAHLFALISLAASIAATVTALIMKFT